LQIALGAFALIAFLFAMVFGYNLKWRKQQVELSKRTNQLEKKNGHEQKQLDQLKAEIQKLKETKFTLSDKEKNA
jgi:cell division protein FtsB